MSQRELRKLEGQCLKLDIRIKKLIIKLLRRVDKFNLSKKERRAWVFLGTLSCVFLVLVMAEILINK